MPTNYAVVCNVWGNELLLYNTISSYTIVLKQNRKIAKQKVMARFSNHEKRLSTYNNMKV